MDRKLDVWERVADRSTAPALLDDSKATESAVLSGQELQLTRHLG
jgi:hypothetical protein